MIPRLTILALVALALPAQRGLARGGGGCFLGDTLILRADGRSVAIRDVRAGDLLLAFDLDGRLTQAPVLDVLARQVDEYLVVTTESGALCVTGEHPFYVGNGTFKTISNLGVGQSVFACDGQALRPRKIVSIQRIRGHTTVYNIQTDQPHTFFANALAVHNKGGGGFGGGGGYGGGGGFGGGGGHGGYGGGVWHDSGTGGRGRPESPITIIVTMVIFVLTVIFLTSRRRAKSRPSQNLDYCFSEAAVANKAQKTRTLLDFIAKQDRQFAPDALLEVAGSTFAKLQECWQARSYGPMKPLMMDDIYNQHCRQIEAMVRSHEINLIEELAVERVDIVNVRYTNNPDNREFTVLITAIARDCYVDDRDERFLRGDQQPARFQEFWTFQLQGGQWLLREIEQTRESDVLKDENFFEPMTDRTVQTIAGGAGQAGPAGPWVEKAAEVKQNRIERLLGFLVQTDKLWDRQAMLDRARFIFTNVFAARQAADVNRVSDDDFFPDVAQSLRQEITSRKAQGAAIEFRNLCIRKVDLVLVRNFDDRTRDEYTVRISYHAQCVVSKGGLVVYQDQYVTPSEEYWTLGRSGDRWKLKEVLPPAKGRTQLSQENLDQDSSPGQLQWYYRQSRAN